MAMEFNGVPSEDEIVAAIQEQLAAHPHELQEFNAWVEHMRTEHPGQPLFVVAQRPRLILHWRGIQQNYPITKHQMKMKALWERFRRTTDNNGWEWAPAYGQEGWENFWKEAIEQRDEMGLRNLLEGFSPIFHASYANSPIVHPSEQDDPYKFLEQEIDTLSAKPSETPENALQRQFWNEQLKGIEGL